MIFVFASLQHACGHKNMTENIFILFYFIFNAFFESSVYTITAKGLKRANTLFYKMIKTVNYITTFIY